MNRSYFIRRNNAPVNSETRTKWVIFLFIDALSSSSVFASIGMGPSTFSRLFIKIDIPPLRVRIRKPPVIEISCLKPFLRSLSPRYNVMCEGSKPALSVEKRSYRNLRLPRHFLRVVYSLDDSGFEGKFNLSRHRLY